jgi:hypothetical protein
MSALLVESLLSNSKRTMEPVSVSDSSFYLFCCFVLILIENGPLDLFFFAVGAVPFVCE